MPQTVIWIALEIIIIGLLAALVKSRRLEERRGQVAGIENVNSRQEPVKQGTKAEGEDRHSGSQSGRGCCGCCK